MKKLIIISASHVWVEGAPRLMTVDEVLAQSWAKAGTLLIAVTPSEVGRVLATVRTLDSAVTQQYPGENSYSTLLLEPNVYQVYVAPDELLNRLRKLGRDVRIVPFPAAVLTEVLGETREKSFIEKTQIFLSAPSLRAPADAVAKELVVIDTVGDQFLITAIRHREVVAVRVAQGDVVTELQRTLAGTRMESPTVICRDEELSLDLRAVGFVVELATGPGDLIGASALKLVEGQRFLNQFEVAQRRAVQSRRKALSFLMVSVVLCVVMASGWLFFRAREAVARTESARLTALKDEQIATLIGLNQERYGSLARAQSLQIREELFDLSISLPPQVVLLSVRKDEQGLSAVVERRPQAAPFSRDDLRIALSTSPAFARAEISEEYEGHIIRYLLKVPPAALPVPPTPSK